MIFSTSELPLKTFQCNYDVQIKPHSRKSHHCFAQAYHKSSGTIFKYRLLPDTKNCKLLRNIFFDRVRVFADFTTDGLLFIFALDI